MEDQPGVPLGIYKAVFRLQAPAATGEHNTCFQQVQDDMIKARSVNRGWEFVSKGTEFSLGKFVPEYFTPLTLDSRSGEGGNGKEGQGGSPRIKGDRLTYDGRDGGREILLAK